MPYEGLIVLGCPRSGTTLVRRLLDAHPNLACPPETVVFARVARMLQEDPMAEGMTFGMRTGLAFAGVSPSETLAATREFAFAFHRRLAAAQNKPRWAAKTAMDAFYVDEIEQLCGDHARFVVLVRHGLDVVASLRDLCVANDVFLPEIHAYVRRHPSLLEALAHLWADVTARLARFAANHPNNVKVVRYEDLVAAPGGEVIADVFAFAGEPDDPTVAERALVGVDGLGFGDPGALARTSIDASRVGRWRALSPHTRARLAPIVGPMLAAHGYDAIPAVPERTEAEARHLFRLGLAAQALKRGKTP